MIALITTGNCVSQSLRYGIKAGLNVSDIVITNYTNIDAESDLRMKTGFHAGAYASADVHEKISLAAELLYSNKGVRAADRINLHYINIPMLMLYKFTDSFLLEAGPELGYLLSARSRYGNVSNTWNNKLDIGLDAGLQFALTETIGLGVRYNAGLSSVIDAMIDDGTNLIPTAESIKYQNRVLQFWVACTIGKKLLIN